MFIGFFKNNSPSAFILLPLFAIAMWVPSLFSEQIVLIKNTMPFYELITSSILIFPIISKIITLILIISEAFLINYIINNNEVLSKQSFVPALLYITYMCSCNDMLMLNPLLFANLFLLFSINKLLSSYRKDIAFSQAFDAGFLLSIATLFYFPCIIFIPLIGVGLVLFRPFIWREWIISIIGLLVPYCFVISYYFWNDALLIFWKEKILTNFYHNIPVFNFSENLYATLIVFAVILFLSFGKLFSAITASSQKTKKGTILLIWCFFLSLIELIFATTISIIYFSMLVIPATVLSANYFLTTKKPWWGEVLFLILLIVIIINHF